MRDDDLVMESLTSNPAATNAEVSGSTKQNIMGLRARSTTPSGHPEYTQQQPKYTQQPKYAQQPRSSSEETDAQRRRRRRAQLYCVLQASKVAAVASAAARQKRSAVKMANTRPLGLFALGMTTMLASLHYTGRWPLFSVVPGMAISFGGGAQLIAGLLGFFRGDSFDYITFMAFGAFWLSMVCAWMLPNASTGGPDAITPSTDFVFGIYFVLWMLFSLTVTVTAIRENAVCVLTFFTMTLMLFLLMIGNLAKSEGTVHAAGYIGTISSGFALYLAGAGVLQELFGRALLPVSLPASWFPQSVQSITSARNPPRKIDAEKAGEALNLRCEETRQWVGDLPSNPSEQRRRQDDDEEAAPFEDE